jgi:hypothetical protein
MTALRNKAQVVTAAIHDHYTFDGVRFQSAGLKRRTVVSSVSFAKNDRRLATEAAWKFISES